MLKLPIKTLCLFVCFIEVAWLLLAQALGNILLLMPCLICFLVIMVWAAFQSMAIPVILFFMPFAPLLKMAPGTISFYTLALLMVYAIYMVKGYKNIRVTHLVPGLALILLTLTMKTVWGFSIENEYILFVISILLVPFMATEIDGRYDYYWVTLFFVLGVVTSAITSQLLSDSASIARYINIVNELGIHRRAGYYGDPNFYSAHITAALGGVLILLMENTERMKRVVLICGAILLFYCGLLSASKSFMLISLCMVILWCVAILFRKGRISSKLLTVITLMAMVVLILSSTVFSGLLDIVWSRLSSGANLSDFTTRRVDLWANYLHEFREHPLILWFGNGISDTLLNGRGSHNTIIQMVYQLGLVGLGLMVAWFVLYARKLLGGKTPLCANGMQILIMIIGVLGPWMGLDYLFFDEFFLLPIYICMAIRFSSKSTESHESLLEEKCGIANE